MAAKKKTQTQKDDTPLIVAFALKDHDGKEDGASGDEGLVMTTGQRLELTQADFDDLAGAGLVAAGVYAKLLEAVEGGRYSLKPHEKTWLAPAVYEAWKAAGICEPTSDDPEVSATLKARQEAVSAAVAERDEAVKEVRAAQQRLSDVNLEIATARAQVEKILILIEGKDDGPLLGEVEKLLDILPEMIDGAPAEPQLGL